VSELRYNIITRDWVVIATERAKRPEDFTKDLKAAPALPVYREGCPFCPGNEGDRSDETFRLGDPRSWRTRSIYNKFPALSHREKLERRDNGTCHSITGFGIAEVIVEHPRHDAVIALMNDAEVEDIIRTYRARYLAVQDTRDIEAVTIFKNHGPRAGTSLEHPHSQLIATPIVPPNVRNRIESATTYFDATGRCPFCHMLEEELRSRVRIVLETEKFVAFMPYASFAPFSVWIFPRRHMSSFNQIDDGETGDLAHILRVTLAKLYHGLKNPDFNYTIRSIPVSEKEVKYFHWYLSIIPRITNPAGFELGSGIFVNVALPEESAGFLRKIECP